MHKTQKTKEFFQKSLTMAKQYDIIIIVDCSDHLSGCGAVGSALPWGGRGRGFKSRHSDQMRSSTPKRVLSFSESSFFILYLKERKLFVFIGQLINIIKAFPYITNYIILIAKFMKF